MPGRRQKQTAKQRTRSFAVKGSLLKQLRIRNLWTQGEAARKAGFSDRLIRKAEVGGPLEFGTIAILADLYSKPERRLTPQELIAKSALRTSQIASVARHSNAEKMVRRWFDELWNHGRLEVIDELASPDCLLHAEGKELRGRESLRLRAREVHAAFSEIKLEIEHLTVQNNLVSCRWRAAVTQSGPWLGAPPTGKRLVVSASTWIRVEDRWLAEGWDYWEIKLDEVVQGK